MKQSTKRLVPYGSHSPKCRADRRNQTVIPGVLLIALFLLATFPSAQATMYLQDGFNYTAGTSVSGNGPWTNTVSVINSNITIAAGGLSYPNLADVSPVTNMVSAAQLTGTTNACATFGTSATSGPVYFSFVSSCTTLPGTAGYYAMGLLPSNRVTPGGRTLDPIVLMLQTNRMGIGTANAAAAVYGPYFTAGTTNLIVLKYNLSTTNASLYFNPTPGGTEPVTPDVTVTGTAGFADLKHVYLRSPSGSGNWKHDSFRIASTWTEVTPLATNPPSITTQPADLTVETGANANFSVLVSGTTPLIYQWYLDGTNSIAGGTNATLTLSNVTTNDAGGYSVTVSNNYGSTSSMTATLTVNPPAIPLVTQNPVSQSVIEGAPVTNSVTVTGSLPLAYQWYFIANGTNAVAAGTNATYIISSSTTNDAGDYYVVITNAYGSATSETISIQVNPNTQPPSIDIQPASQSAPAGANVSFSVTASGASPLSYQWRKDTISILPGSNSSATNAILNLSNISTNDQAGYDVIVTNAFGSVTSSVATLTIITNSLPINPNDFINPRFSSVTVTSNVQYATGSSYYYLDVYQPQGDTNTSRPVIVWIHGGSNQTGTDKTQGYIVTYCNDFAKRGYVCMSIDYRVYSSASYDCSTDKDWCKLPAIRNGATDTDLAFQWIRANAATYNINTNWMFVAGGSAGGKVALNWAYVDGTNAPSTPGRTFNKRGLVALADLWGSPEYPMRWYVGPVNTNSEYSGGGTYIGNEPPYHFLNCGAPPTVIVHGTADTTVPFQNSIDLSNQLAAVGATFELNPIVGANHTPTSDSRIEPWVANFFAKYWWGALTNTPPAAPTASFTMSVTNGAPPLPVTLTDTSTGCISGWAWNFGDGNTTNFPNSSSTNFPPVARNTAHTFAAGTYTVTETVTGPYGTSIATNIVIAGLNPPPVALFSATPTNGVEPLNVSFTDASTNSPTGWSWDFGDAGTSTLQNPSHSYTTAGVYTVKLMASNGGGSSTNTKTAYINVITAAQSWQNHYGVTPDTSDPFGKGISNTNQFLAGFNPTNPAAYPHVISVQASGADMNITYLGASGDNAYVGGPQSRTNVLEYTAGVGGSYSNNFASAGVSQVLSNGNGSGSVSTMTDLGGTTNVPSRYYRVRVLVP